MILEFAAGYIAADALDGYMAEQRTITGDRGAITRIEGIGRTVEGGANLRPIPSDPVPIPAPEPLTPRSIGSPRAPISRGNIPIYAPPQPGSAPGPPAGSQDSPTDGERFGYSDQFGAGGLLADLVLRLFGADETDTPRPPIVVGDAGFAGRSGGGNTALIVLILVAVGGAGYYFFVYKKGGAQ